jgi:hypothetical protein
LREDAAKTVNETVKDLLLEGFFYPTNWLKSPQNGANPHYSRKLTSLRIFCRCEMMPSEIHRRRSQKQELSVQPYQDP